MEGIVGRRRRRHPSRRLQLSSYRRKPQILELFFIPRRASRLDACGLPWCKPLLGTTVGPSRNHHQTIHRSIVQLSYGKNNKVTGPCLRAAKGRHQSSSPSWRPDCLSHNKQQNIKENDGVCVCDPEFSVRDLQIRIYTYDTYECMI